MTAVIDTNVTTTGKLDTLKALGIKTIIRYINPLGTAGEKTVKPSEAHAIAAAGLRLGLVCEGWGGTQGRGVDRASGDRDGERCRDYAKTIGAPVGACIYFAVDVDMNNAQIQSLAIPYFQEINKDLGGIYRVGVYGCGAVCSAVQKAGLAELTWLTNAMGWNGSRAYLASGKWNLLQHLPKDIAGLDTDPDEINPARPDIGDFVPFAAALPTPAPTPPAPPASTILFHVEGKMSTFGGPRDMGMSSTEGLALYETDEDMTAEGLGDWLLTPTQANASGLGRRLRTDKPYLACRWDYHVLPKSTLRHAQIEVTNPTTGKSAMARAVDWGPNANTGRVADLSPGLARELGLNTDDVVRIRIYKGTV